jgi:membrane associated rhomboid family serine protease
MANSRAELALELSLTDREDRLPTPWIVWLITAALIGSYVAFWLQPFDLKLAIDGALALTPADFQSELASGAWGALAGRLIGHVFLHAAWWHVGLNAFFFYATGRYPALRLGPWRFLALFIISASLSAFAYLALNWGEDIGAIGASGAVCGTFSAYVLSARATWRESLSDPRVRGPFAMIFLLNVVLMGFLSEGGVFPIAWEAHLGGFAGGALAYIALAPKPRGPWG